ncbi:MAG: protein kinase domain-containing protein, partial [Nannocystaceae bacterium]
MSLVGQQLGNYRLKAKLGEGGMGAVYEAEHLALRKQVAIKVLRREFTANDTLVQRFFTEAVASAKIRHPGIVDVYDYGKHNDGSAFLVMEKLIGEDLGARIDRVKRLQLAEAVPLLYQIATVLHAA